MHGSFLSSLIAYVNVTNTCVAHLAPGAVLLAMGLLAALVADLNALGTEATKRKLTVVKEVHL